MKTFEKFRDGLKDIPLATSWFLNDIAEMKGRQQLFYAQSVHKLKTLKEPKGAKSQAVVDAIDSLGEFFYYRGSCKT